MFTLVFLSVALIKRLWSLYTNEMAEEPSSSAEACEEFDNSIKEKLFTKICGDEKKSPCKVTVVGVGMVGMACSMSILMKVDKWISENTHRAFVRHSIFFYDVFCENVFNRHQAFAFLLNFFHKIIPSYFVCVTCCFFPIRIATKDFLANCSHFEHECRKPRIEPSFVIMNDVKTITFP